MHRLCNCFSPSQCWQRLNGASDYIICKIRSGLMKDEDTLKDWAKRANAKGDEDKE